MTERNRQHSRFPESQSPMSPGSICIEFVCDVICPWSVVGLEALQKAVETARATADASVALHLRPLILNQHLLPRSASSVPVTASRNRLSGSYAGRNYLRQRGLEAGFSFNFFDHICNTLDAHRLLCWATQQDAVQPWHLLRALQHAHFTDGDNITSTPVLLRQVEAAGLDPQRAAGILRSDQFAAEVNAQDQRARGLGIRSTPSIIFNDRQVISGTRSVAQYLLALRRPRGQTEPPDQTGDDQRACAS